MKRIDRETVQRILDAADIVEVVSDFVNLKKRGANYIGLCPFHNERTPSFSVSKSKGICKCFSCGKGGSPLNFIMEHEQLGYYDALRYLARKYHIEIKEHEMTDQEREAASQREALLAVNDFALKHFTRNLQETGDGRDIGLSYFRERGINDRMIERFSLGYALERGDTLYKDAIAAGYEEQNLLLTGLCARNDRGRVYDRFRGRVIYPVFSLSGRVVAFGGRTLRTDKSMAKYVNSPESPIYSKSRELYGLYQAKRAIVQQGKCILVEGYMDVISMHQVGVENVVASSGTSLTEGQIRLIHRFTDNVTLIYDSDAAGIKAALRGVDMLLAEGMNIKVLLLPDGDDPDSFAQHHSSSEVEEYIKHHETDFIRFKTDILLREAQTDPVARARVINDIMHSIAVVPDAVVRAEYVKMCSRMLDIDEKVLVLQMQKFMAENAMKRGQGRSTESGDTPANDTTGEKNIRQEATQTPPQVRPPVIADKNSRDILESEKQLIKYIVKYGLAELPVEEDEQAITVLEYIWYELEADGIQFTHPTYARIFERAKDIQREQWPRSRAQAGAAIDSEIKAMRDEGIEKIRNEATDLADIQARETTLDKRCSELAQERLLNYTVTYLESIFISDPDDEIRKLSTELVTERYVLSKVHTHYSYVPTEMDRLGDLVPRAVAELKLGIINAQIDETYAEIKQNKDYGRVVELLQRQKELFECRISLSKFLGERIVTPPRK